MLQANPAQAKEDAGSFSRLSCWLNCPRKYQFEYIEEAPAECTPASLLLGSAIHEAVEGFMDSLKKVAPLSSEEVSGVFHRAVNDSAALAEEQGTPVEFSSGGLAELLAKGDAMLAEFLAKVDRAVQVVGTEVAFEFELEPGRRFRGYIDLILRQGNGRLMVVDLKTSSTTYSQDRIEFDLQPTLYIAAAEWLFDAESRVDFEYWLLTKTKSPSFKIIPVHRVSTTALNSSRRHATSRLPWPPASSPDSAATAVTPASSANAAARPDAKGKTCPDATGAGETVVGWSLAATRRSSSLAQIGATRFWRNASSKRSRFRHGWMPCWARSTPRGAWN